MSKEELKKEAEESAKKFFGKPTDLVDLDNLRIFKNGYLAGAEPREKRITDLEAENEQIKNSDTLCKLIGEQKRKITDLEAQIEKMKNCGNCKNFSPTYGLCCYSLGDEDYDCRLRKWEIKENDIGSQK